ncbi:MAG: class I SAM-dependent RNA methyltransferase, partial [Spirochaetaceae bacterium]
MIPRLSSIMPVPLDPVGFKITRILSFICAIIFSSIYTIIEHRPPPFKRICILDLIMVKDEYDRIMAIEADTIEITITGLGHEGEGVGRTADIVVFVPGALLSEEVSVRIIERKKSFCRAELVQIISPSPDRITPACRYFGKCGGCDLQHMEYKAQLNFKTQRVKDAVRRIGRVDPDLVR